MPKQHIATYRTRSGLIALQIFKRTLPDGSIYYSYEGKHGAGSGHQLPMVRSTVRIMLETHRGIRLTEGTDILTTETKPA